MPERPAGLSQPLADRGVLRLLRRPLRPARQDHVPHRGGQGRAGPTGGRTTSRCARRSEHGEPQRARDAQLRATSIVANGHHWDPRWPEPSYPGSDTFPGTQMHAHYYRTPDVLEGKRVLVLGIGNSASDIAVEASRVADETYLAMRRGAHIVPKFMFGVPTDHLTESPLARGPLALQQLRHGARCCGSRRARSPTTGCRKPDHAVLHAHPTVSDDLLTRLGHGDITVVPNIDRFEGSKVFFTDGRAAEVDMVIYCTGYKVTFPFLDERVVPPRENHVDLYRRVVDPEHPGLLLRRTGAAARRDHAAGRGAVRVGRRPDLRRGCAAVVRRDAPADPDLRREGQEALRRLEAAHHPGGLPHLPRGARPRAPRLEGAGRR